MGVSFAGLLIFLDCGDAKRKAYIPACLSFALLIEWFSLLVISVAMALPSSNGTGLLSP